MKKKSYFCIFLVFIGIFMIYAIFSLHRNQPKQDSILIASTTSLQDSGLLDELLPEFYKKTGITAKVIAVGTGQALQLGRDGEVDVLLVHDQQAEEEFVREGHGMERWNVMYNDFVLVGPKEDRFHIKDQTKGDILQAFQIIWKNQVPFVSRGDASGTHKKELAIWKQLEKEPIYASYISAGRGMGDVLKMADELGAYTLADRGTYVKHSEKLDLEIVVEGDRSLINMYGVIPVDPHKNKAINKKGAQAFVKWILSPPVQEKIGAFGMDSEGRPLFNPCGEISP